MKFAHAMIRVQDLERSIAFYTDLIGLKLERTRELGDEATLAFLADDLGRPLVELTYNKDGRTYTHGDAFGHLAFTTPDLEAVTEEVRRRGWWYRTSKPPGRYIFIKDPDGYDVEILQERT